jgi:glycolate oxidase FAD binding subunit
VGILGVITEVSLKVLPKPRVEQTFRFAMSAQQAVETFNRWSGQPLPLSAASWYNGTARIRLSGTGAAVRAARERLGGDLVNQSMADEWWGFLRHHTHPLLSRPTVWRLSVPDTTPPLDLPDDPLIDWGGALRWYATDAPDIREIAVSAGGGALCWQGTPPAEGRFHPLKPAVAALHRRLKEKFDPHGIFNPGRMIAGI